MSQRIVLYIRQGKVLALYFALKRDKFNILPRTVNNDTYIGTWDTALLAAGVSTSEEKGENSRERVKRAGAAAFSSLGSCLRVETYEGETLIQFHLPHSLLTKLWANDPTSSCNHPCTLSLSALFFLSRILISPHRTFLYRISLQRPTIYNHKSVRLPSPSKYFACLSSRLPSLDILYHEIFSHELPR